MRALGPSYGSARACSRLGPPVDVVRPDVSESRAVGVGRAPGSEPLAHARTPIARHTTRTTARARGTASEARNSSESRAPPRRARTFACWLVVAIRSPVYPTHSTPAVRLRGVESRREYRK